MRLQRPEHGAHSQAQPGSDGANAKALSVKKGHAITVEDLSWPVCWEILARSALDGLSNFSAGIIVPVTLLTSEGPFLDQRSLEFRSRSQDVQHATEPKISHFYMSRKAASNFRENL
jgi:hypothetical protein